MIMEKRRISAGNIKCDVIRETRILSDLTPELASKCKARSTGSDSTCLFQRFSEEKRCTRNSIGISTWKSMGLGRRHSEMNHYMSVREQVLEILSPGLFRLENLEKSMRSRIGEKKFSPSIPSIFPTVHRRQLEADIRTHEIFSK